DSRAAPPVAAGFEGEIASLSCALAKECPRDGRRPLRAGGLLMPPTAAAFEDASKLNESDQGSCRLSFDQVQKRYQAALTDAPLDIRLHLPTLLEYGRRVRTVAHVGETASSSLTSFAHAALERGSSASQSSSWRYKLGLHSPHAAAEAACSDLLELSLGSASGEVEPAELLFFSAAWRDPQHLFQELATYGLQAERYILVHAASTAASNSLEGGIDAWLQSPGANGWSLLEHTLLGGGLAVLGLSPPAWSTTNATRSGGSCDPTRAMRSRRALREARSMASELLILNGNYPGMWAGSWRLDEQKVEAVRQQLSLAVRLCPSDSKDALAARKVLRRSFLGQ
ncbi:unnamed protein product, partial [Polarella glacialis]